MHFCWFILLRMHEPMLALGSPEHGADVLEGLLDSGLLLGWQKLC